MHFFRFAATIVGFFEHTFYNSYVADFYFNGLRWVIYFSALRLIFWLHHLFIRYIATVLEFAFDIIVARVIYYTLKRAEICFCAYLALFIPFLSLKGLRLLLR